MACYELTMPRKARIDAPGALHHIICRGIERGKIFRDDEDCNRFLDRLGEVLLDTGTPCFAWALIPNHIHLLFKTGQTSLPTVMRRILTGHAVYFNRRHRRHGQLFQNRYKSILCQEDSYLLELVRYIHLNPLRAHLVPEMKELDKYAFSGHSVLMGKTIRKWQDTDYVLGFFGAKLSTARRRYKAYVQKGVDQGKRPDLTGGGLIRSLGGWSSVKALRDGGERLKGDERILGDSDFVERVVDAANEHMERRYLALAKGFDLDSIAERVGEVLGISPALVWATGKRPQVVKARSLLCYWASKELGITMTALARRLGISQPAVSIAVRRGETMAMEKDYRLIVGQ
jgi:putative transposase